MAGFSNYRMETGHLRKDELEFELKCRDVDVTGKSVDELRSLLRPLIQAERRGAATAQYTFAYSYDTEFPLIEKKYRDVLKDVNDFQCPTCTTLDQKRLYSRIYHLLNRVNIAPTGDDVTPEQLASRATWLSNVSGLFAILENAIRTRISLGALNYSSAVGDGSQQPGSGSDSDSSTVPSVVPSPVLNSTRVRASNAGIRARNTSVPVHKWSYKFSGEAKDSSVLSFLERVEQLRVARSVSQHELFLSATDLFEGKALLWFRSVQPRVHNWQELSDLLTLHYLPPDYRHRLFQEILSRTQGREEKIIDYLAMMNALCRRHGSMSDDVRLSIISRNLSPFYLDKLPPVSSLDELEAECLKLEARKYRVEHYQVPSSTLRNRVEPALAYVSSEPFDETLSEVMERGAREQPRGSNKCHGCGGVGHFVRNCPNKRHCFKCKHLNVTVKTCPKCNPTPSTSGNAGASR